jgi:Polyketide cyclase / dehydrase and lipid transport
MRAISVFIISVITIMFFFSMITLLLPSRVTVSKSIIINASVTEVAKEIEDFENWKKWYPAFQNEDIIVSTLQKGGSSFVTVTGEKGKKFSMTMIHARPGNINILLSEGNKNQVTYEFLLSPGKTSTTLLTWNVKTTLRWYPWKKITGIFLDKIYGPQYQEVLQNLKISVEKLHQERSSG